tara:strand:+ start:832 stop:1425 length:594 start_codon:yes stop_codon:yes gene_type:complete
MDRKIHYNFPFFGPFIMQTKLTKEEVKALKKLCKKDKKKDARKNLAGHLDHEYDIDVQKYQDIIMGYLDAYRDGYYKFYGRPLGKLVTSGAWVNYMKAGDYNPPHVHTQCHYSSVLYTDIPEALIKEGENSVTQSYLPGSLIFQVFPYQSELSIGRQGYFPKEGDLYIFPHNTQHEVVPFKSKGTRISIAANFIERK